MPLKLLFETEVLGKTLRGFSDPDTDKIVQFHDGGVNVLPLDSDNPPPVARALDEALAALAEMRAAGRATGVPEDKLDELVETIVAGGMRAVDGR